MADIAIGIDLGTSNSVVADHGGGETEGHPERMG
jgi:molecular chaperone DnaK (HSP70)